MQGVWHILSRLSRTCMPTWTPCLAASVILKHLSINFSSSLLQVSVQHPPFVACKPSMSALIYAQQLVISRQAWHQKANALKLAWTVFLKLPLGNQVFMPIASKHMHKEDRSQLGQQAILSEVHSPSHEDLDFRPMLQGLHKQCCICAVHGDADRCLPREDRPGEGEERAFAA